MTTRRVETYEKTFAGREPLIAQHQAGGTGILPASVQLEMAVVALAGRGGFVPVELTGVEFLRPFAVAADATAVLRLEVGDGTFALRDAAARVSGGAGAVLTAPAEVAAWTVQTGRQVAPATLYAGWSGAGLEYGPDFRTVAALSVGEGTAEAVLRTAATSVPWHAHPLIVDGVFQVVSCALQEIGPDGPRPMLPIGVARIAVLGQLSGAVTEVTVRVRRTAVEGAYSVADAIVLDPAGVVIAELTGVRMRRLPGRASAENPLVTRIAWAAAPEAAPRVPATGTWVVLHRGDDLGARTAAALRSEGAAVLEPGPVADEAGFEALWASVGGPVDGVVHMLSTGPARPEADELREGLHGVLALFKTLGRKQRKGRVFVVTSDGQPLVGDDRPIPARAALWGLVRTAAIEYTGLKARVIDVDGPAEYVLADLGDGPVEAGRRAGTRYLPTRVPAPLTTAKPGVRTGGRYLIVGGHGGLGLAVAERFAREGAAVIALLSRSGGTGADVSAIEAHGCRVLSYAVDAATPGALAAVVAEIRRDHGDLHGVIHAAGTLADKMIRSATTEDIDTVMGPKVDGVARLAEALDTTALDFAALFASVSGTFGNLGQAGYAAANAYLDAYAHTAGAPWIALDWGLWGEIGMGVAVADQLRKRGVRPLGTTEALDALLAALRTDTRQVVIAHRDVPPGEVPESQPPAQSAPAQSAPAPAPTPPTSTPSPAPSPEATLTALMAFMSERLSVPNLDPDAPLTDYGMNSIMSVELAEELSRRWRTQIPATLFLEYNDLTELSEALTDRYKITPPTSTPPPAAPLAETPSTANTPTDPPADPAPTGGKPPSSFQTTPDGTRQEGESPDLWTTRESTGDIAIVAVSGDLPGATTLDGFWQMIRAGRDAFTEVPADRWDIAEHYQPREPEMTGTYCRTGAFVDEIDRMDPKFFGISVRESDDLDPQQKLLLEHAWSVIDDGGLAGRKDVGVFVGATYTHFRDAQGLDQIGPHTALGSMNAILANRISFALDLSGPSMTVDTLCSSSLVAVQQAVQALRSGHCGGAVVAACHVGLTPWYYRSLSQLGALSQSKPRPFDERADGFVPGEGAIAVLLKRLEDAERDGDRVWGVIRGAAVNHGGRGSALPVPRSGAQVEVVRAALADAGVEPDDITLLETHGTATQLGDPIEISALTEVFAGRETPAAIGSVKANIGHLEPASGLAGLVKVLLCLENKEIPPLAGYGQPAAKVDLSAGVVTIPTEPVPWAGPRRAGISAFGMGGSNAHIVVEEHSPVRREPGNSADEHVLTVSAHTPEALARRAADLADFLESRPGVTAGQVCFSANVGRYHMPHRIAVVGRDVAELVTGLRAAQPGTVHRGAFRIHHEVGDRYVGGGKVDWRAVQPVADRISLPAYPFRAERAESVDVYGRVMPAHRVFGAETVPAALLLEMGFESADALTGVALTAMGTGAPPLTMSADAGDALTFRHGSRVIATAAGAEAGLRPPPVNVDALRADYPRSLAPEGLYAWFAAKGMELAEPLTPIAAIAFGDDGVLIGLDDEPGHPKVRAVAALDAALQSMAVLTLADPTASEGTYLPVSLGRVTRWADPSATTTIHLRMARRGESRVGAVTMLDAAGRVLVAMEDVVFRVVGATRPTEEPTDLAPTDLTPTNLTPADLTPADLGPAAEPAPRADVLDTVLGMVREVLRDPSVTPTTVLSQAGMDSMLATMVTVSVERGLGVKLTPMDVLDARDCRALADTIAEDLPDPTPATTQEPPRAAPTTPRGTALVQDIPSTGSEHHSSTMRRSDAVSDQPAEASTIPDPTTVDPRDIAVIGFACAVPGATEPDGLWEMLAAGESGVGPAPSFRWSGEADAVGGFLADIDEFDARFFDFFPKQAEVLDPQVRWLLRTAWEALESAGIPPLAAPTSTGVFVGASYSHYKDYNLAPELDANAGLGNHNAFLANRVSYFLNLSGPSMTIDTLCSSSLVALHTAVRSLRDGECEQAVVAGVRLAMSPLHYTAMSNLRALSPTGASRAFDGSADGFVPGEGVVTVLVKPLAAALRDGDPVRGVIKGTAVNHGGRTSGLTVPSPTAQNNVITAALADARVAPDTIGLLEAHGTGTSLGDPIEIEGVTRAWRSHTDRTQFCAIGSLKSNIGHLEPAAGLAGMVKALLAMEKEHIPPTLHVVRPNDHIRFEGTPFFIADRTTRWERGDTPRRAAVSAFGMGGVNAHVVLEEAPLEAPRDPAVPGGHLLWISAAAEDSVRALAGRYADKIAQSSGERETADLCHTGNVGRSPLGFQTAVRGADTAALVAELRAVEAGSAPVVGIDPALPAPVLIGSLAERQGQALLAIRRGCTSVALGELSAPGSRIVCLPTYPFAKASFWHQHRAAVQAGPRAVRSRWAVTEPVVATRLPATPVRVVGADPALVDLVTAELAVVGARVGADQPSTVVVVGSGLSAADSDAELAAFWDDLRGLLVQLPPGGTLVWAEHATAAIGDHERRSLRPGAAAALMAVRAAAAENRLSVTTVDLDPDDPPELRAWHIATELAAMAPESNTAVAYRGMTRHVERQLPAQAGPAAAITADGYYLVTGGLGAVGRRLAAHLVRQGARRLAILGRSALTRDAAEFLASLKAEVDYARCDVADEVALNAVLDGFDRRWGALRGAVHASGGVNKIGMVRRREWSAVTGVLAPKFAGTRAVVRAAAARGARFAALVSSIAGALPQAGRGLVDYTLANAYQLALAEMGDHGDTVVTAHAWPDWTGIGMAADPAFAAHHSITEADALAGFTAHLCSGGAVVFPGEAAPALAGSTPAQSAAVPVLTAVPDPRPDVPAVTQLPVVQQPVPVARPVVHEQATVVERVPEPVPVTVIPQPAQPPARVGDPAAAALAEVVGQVFLDVLGTHPGARRIADLGLDSITIAELTSTIETRIGSTVDPGILLRARTIAEVAAQLAPASSTVLVAEAQAPAPPPAPAIPTEPVTALSSLLRGLVDRERSA
ncbi:SDR family NAD(P)-dependent oxidoreductase [Actinokineospora guangxiensis]|uniref:SDR family NAD(P)-dependent oxidoreductase n=1 Tax=Actinokineospora guangxiensis TaxID=1490288 RepID=A0ABW0EQ07_9PSEU